MRTYEYYMNKAHNTQNVFDSRLYKKMAQRAKKRALKLKIRRYAYYVLIVVIMLIAVSSIMPKKQDTNIDAKPMPSSVRMTTPDNVITVSVADAITASIDNVQSDIITIETPKISQSDLDWLAHVIAGEAIGCDDTEQRYVASVVLNRVKHKLFPDTIAEVITQRGQYACYSNGKWTNAGSNPTQQCYDNAQYVLENGSQLPDNVVFQAQFTQGAGVYVETKWHKYCYTDR